MVYIPFLIRVCICASVDELIIMLLLIMYRRVWF